MSVTVAYLGNLSPSVPHSTENDLAWSFRHLGHEVIPLQENKVAAKEVYEAAKDADLLLWTHTHSWVVEGDIDLVLRRLEENGVITAAFHLDRYWGLDNNDRRETRIGLHPFWSCQFVFTADGGNQDRFRERGIAHYWLPPAVVERDCYAGTYRSTFAADVGFVGAKYYHSEYPFRTKLITWLEKTYGKRFRRFAADTSSGTVRGSDLNDVYASIKVVVGDSCFAGSPRYYSDRVPETLGRRGFLIHPETPGLEIPGLVTYPPGDLNRLKELVDYYLEHEEERQQSIKEASSWVESYETYTQRVETLLEVVGL